MPANIIANGFCAGAVNDSATRWYIAANANAAGKYLDVTGNHFEPGVRVGAADDIRRLLAACAPYDAAAMGQLQTIAAPEITDFPGVAPALAARALNDARRRYAIVPCANWGWGRCDGWVIRPWATLQLNEYCPECESRRG